MEIPEFYEDCEIFVTGGSGVVGKALIDKLLRSCNVRRIYVLLRTKKNFSVEERVEKIRNAKVFRVLRSNKPEELQKIVPIPGDVELPNLGITPAYAKVMENVSIVFHCAATVRFDEPLKVALTLNVGGTVEALKFAETLKRLKIFMHVSTFYSNPYLSHVESKFYSSPMDWKFCLDLLKDESKQDILDILTKKIIMGFPNTYTFTKNLAESVVNDYYGRLPVVIYRPSIVLFALRDPEPGFSPSLMGAMGLFTLVGAGILKTVYLGDKTRLDITPQDIGVKSMLYYALKADEEIKEGKLDTVPVYMTSSYKIATYTFTEMAECMEKENLWNNVAFQKCFLLPSCTYTSSRFHYMFLVFTKQVFPALLADFLMILFGRKPLIMSIVRKAFITLEVMQPFMFNTYSSSGITNLEDMTRRTRGTDFEIDTDLVVSKTYEGLKQNCNNMAYSVREVLLGEDPSTLEKARKVLRIKRIVYNVMRSIFAYYIIRWLYRITLVYFSENTV